jgi:predicted DNA-binding transcriptional regulator AlpA
MTMAESPKNLIDDREAACLLNVAPVTMRKMRIAGTGPRYVKIGARVRYDPAEIAKFVADHTVRSTSENAGRKA